MNYLKFHSSHFLLFFLLDQKETKNQARPNLDQRQEPALDSGSFLSFGLRADNAQDGALRAAIRLAPLLSLI